MFIDKIKLTLSAGRGGDGVVAWRREKFIPKGGPFGGDGGDGGSIYFKVTPEETSLDHLRNQSLIHAENGRSGGGNCRSGRRGKDSLLYLPMGTLVKESKTGRVLFDFVDKNCVKLICKGGKGGKGNYRFKSSTCRAPSFFTKGSLGESGEFELELKLLADVGFIGKPNAGKSSLMKAITSRKVAIGSYPFTTLTPNMAYIDGEGRSRILVADIPGIIEGAHLGRGLGHHFLRHVERSTLLVYVIDISGNQDPLEDFRLLRHELKKYCSSLADKPFIVALNKIDLEGAADNALLFYQQEPGLKLFEISALDGTGIALFREALRQFFLSHASAAIGQADSSSTS